MILTDTRCTTLEEIIELEMHFADPAKREMNATAEVDYESVSYEEDRS